MSSRASSLLVAETDTLSLEESYTCDAVNADANAVTLCGALVGRFSSLKLWMSKVAEMISNILEALIAA